MQVDDDVGKVASSSPVIICECSQNAMDGRFVEVSIEYASLIE